MGTKYHTPRDTPRVTSALTGDTAGGTGTANPAVGKRRSTKYQGGYRGCQPRGFFRGDLVFFLWRLGRFPGKNGPPGKNKNITLRRDSGGRCGLVFMRDNQKNPSMPRHPRPTGRCPSGSPFIPRDTGAQERRGTHGDWTPGHTLGGGGNPASGVGDRGGADHCPAYPVGSGGSEGGGGGGARLCTGRHRPGKHHRLGHWFGCCTPSVL